MTTLSKKEVYEGPKGVTLTLDYNDHDTPAIIEWQGFTATYDCGMDTGELDCGAGPDLLQEQLDWLEQFRDEVNEAYQIARAGMRQYQ